MIVRGVKQKGRGFIETPIDERPWGARVEKDRGFLDSPVSRVCFFLYLSLVLFLFFIRAIAKQILALSGDWLKFLSFRFKNPALDSHSRATHYTHHIPPLHRSRVVPLAIVSVHSKRLRSGLLEVGPYRLVNPSLEKPPIVIIMRRTTKPTDQT